MPVKYCQILSNIVKYCQILQRKRNGTTSLTTRMLLFWQRNKDNPSRVFKQERSWVINLSVWYIFFHCFIDNNTYISVYIVFTSKWMIKKETENTFLRYLGLDAIYKCFVYFFLSNLSSSYVIAMFFISAVWKLSVDLKPQESEVLKTIYGLKFFYLAEEEKPFFHNGMQMAKNVIVLFTSWTANR